MKRMTKNKGLVERADSQNYQKGRVLTLGVAISPEALAGIVLALGKERTYVKSKSEAVAMAVEMSYRYLVTRKIIEPILTIEQANGIFEVYGLSSQDREQRGQAAVLRLMSEQEEEEDRVVQSGIPNYEAARRIIAANRIIEMPEFPTTELRRKEKQVPLTEDEIDRLRREKDSRPVISAIPPEMLEQMKRDEEAREKGEEG